MRLLEPALKNSINAYQAEKTGKSEKPGNSNGSKMRNSSKRSPHPKETGARSTRRKHAYSHGVVYPSDYGPYGPYAPYGPYGGYYRW